MRHALKSLHCYVGDYRIGCLSPHGEVRAVWYNSTTLGQPRRMHVYTPPGYECGNEKYPVLYLIDGGGDDDFTPPRRR